MDRLDILQADVSDDKGYASSYVERKVLAYSWMTEEGFNMSLDYDRWTATAGLTFTKVVKGQKREINVPILFAKETPHGAKAVADGVERNAFLKEVVSLVKTKLAGIPWA